MTLNEAFTKIYQFWPEDTLFTFGQAGAAARLQAEFGQELPAELTEYLDQVAPLQDVDFETVGNPLTLYGISRLGARQPGYNWNPLTQQLIPGWNPDYFLLADEGADPVVLDLTQPAAGLQKLWHGAGNWEAGETVANTLGQFLLCAAAVHHALTAFEPEPIIDDEHGFNLAPPAAAWLFPRLKNWAGPCYEVWSGAFTNA